MPETCTSPHTCGCAHIHVRTDAHPHTCIHHPRVYTHTHVIYTHAFICLTHTLPSLFFTPPPPGPHFAEYLHWDVTEECEVRLVCKVRGGSSESRECQTLTLCSRRGLQGAWGARRGAGCRQTKGLRVPGTCSFPDFQSCLGSPGRVMVECGSRHRWAVYRNI